MDIKQFKESKENNDGFQLNLSKGEMFDYGSLITIITNIINKIDNISMEARKQFLLYELDNLSINKSTASFRLHILENKLSFINIFPSALIYQFNSFVTSIISEFPYFEGKVVFELKEFIIAKSICNSLKALKVQVYFHKDHIGKSAFFLGFKRLFLFYITKVASSHKQLTFRKRKKLITSTQNVSRETMNFMLGTKMEEMLYVSSVQNYFLEVLRKINIENFYSSKHKVEE
ncbi:hypothetical protein G4D61_05440 [Bacillus ginsengihumi]|nr:hypothetical protein [Heyndrickxia ginsengihumi]NEY19411.1 hypothetical protein [Heyndrickxia ginsengihumi]